MVGVAGGAVGSASGPIRKAGGGGGGGYDRVSGGPGYSTVVEFMRADINRQRNRAAIIKKCGPKSYEFINGGGGGHVPRVSPPPPPPPPPPWIRRWAHAVYCCLLGIKTCVY